MDHTAGFTIISVAVIPLRLDKGEQLTAVAAEVHYFHSLLLELGNCQSRLKTAPTSVYEALTNLMGGFNFDHTPKGYGE
jgi:hypothetical protein